CRMRWEELQPVLNSCPHPSPLHGCEFAARPAAPPLIVQRSPHFTLPSTRPMRQLWFALARLPIVGRLVPATAWQPDDTLYRIRLIRARPCPSPPVARPCVDAILL